MFFKLLRKTMNYEGVILVRGPGEIWLLWIKLYLCNFKEKKVKVLSFVVHFTFWTAMYKSFSCSTTSPVLHRASLNNCRHSDRCVVTFHISNTDVENLFTCLFAVHIFSLVNCLFISFVRYMICKYGIFLQLMA